jgi:hypothetical protein
LEKWAAAVDVPQRYHFGVEEKERESKERDVEGKEKERERERERESPPPSWRRARRRLMCRKGKRNWNVGRKIFKDCSQKDHSTIIQKYHFDVKEKEREGKERDVEEKEKYI